MWHCKYFYFHSWQWCDSPKSVTHNVSCWIRLLWSQCWSNPSKEATTWQLSLFEDPFCPLPVTGMYTQQSEKVTMNYTIAVNLLLHTFSLYKICWPFYCFSMLSKATTRTGIDIVLSVVYASLYKRCLTLNRLLSSLLLLLLYIWFVSLISWDPSAGWLSSSRLKMLNLPSCHYSRFLRVSWSSVQSQDDFEQAETSSWAGSEYSKHQPALPNCTFQSARLK